MLQVTVMSFGQSYEAVTTIHKKSSKKQKYVVSLQTNNTLASCKKSQQWSEPMNLLP